MQHLERDKTQPKFIFMVAIKFRNVHHHNLTITAQLQINFLPLMNLYSKNAVIFKNQLDAPRVYPPWRMKKQHNCYVRMYKMQWNKLNGLKLCVNCMCDFEMIELGLCVYYQYGVRDATELITRNARDYMFFQWIQTARLSDSNTLLQSNQSTTLAACVSEWVSVWVLLHVLPLTRKRTRSLFSLCSFRSDLKLFGSVFTVSCTLSTGVSSWCAWVCIDIFFLFALRVRCKRIETAANHCSEWASLIHREPHRRSSVFSIRLRLCHTYT